MDPLLVLLLLGVICMAAMAPMILFGHRHRVGPYADQAMLVDLESRAVAQ